MDFYSVLFAKKHGHCEDYYSELLASALKSVENQPITETDTEGS